jgi:hypothetical protein
LLYDRTEIHKAAEAMNLPLLGLNSWRAILLGLALEVAVENVGLVVVSFLTERSWWERILLVVPLAAFAWLLGTARGIQSLAIWWSSYFAFQYMHYPPATYMLLYAQIQQEYRLVLEHANHLGWTAVLVTEGMVLFGGMLVLRWGTGVWWGRDTTLVRPTPAEEETGELEITVEPLHRSPE